MTKYLIDYKEASQDEFQRELEETIYDHVENGYDDELDEAYPEYEIMGMSFSPSQVLKECDPTAYKCGINDSANDELNNANYILNRGQEYFIDHKVFSIEETDDEEEEL